MALQVGDMFSSQNAKAGTAHWYTKGGRLMDKFVSEIVLVDKEIAGVHFRLIRNSKLELEFTYSSMGVTRSAKADLKEIDCREGIHVQLTWGHKESFIKISDMVMLHSFTYPLD